MAVLARVAGVNATETYARLPSSRRSSTRSWIAPGARPLAYPDSDEFFAYPCDVEAVVARDGAVHGHMVERIAANWEFGTPRAAGRRAPALPAQFPLQCRVTGRHLQANHFKKCSRRWWTATASASATGRRTSSTASTSGPRTGAPSAARPRATGATLRALSVHPPRLRPRAAEARVHGKILAGGETAETRVAARAFLFRRGAPGRASSREVAARQDAEFLRAESRCPRTRPGPTSRAAPGRAELQPMSRAHFRNSRLGDDAAGWLRRAVSDPHRRAVEQITYAMIQHDGAPHI